MTHINLYVWWGIAAVTAYLVTEILRTARWERHWRRDRKVLSKGTNAGGGSEPN